MIDEWERLDAARLRDRPDAEVLIIGGGINGLAVFRHLALQGIDVALVERGDYCSGASAASSHMIHGGIRYLENGEFGLVRESVRERNDLLRTAPHFVHPLRTTIPIFSTFSGLFRAAIRFLTHRPGPPTQRGALLIKIGLTLYDFYSIVSAGWGDRVAHHSMSGRRRSLERLPELNPDVKYTATYFDASVHRPERLAIDVLMDALAASPTARSANYVEAISSDADGVRLRDEVTGEEWSFTARVVINASGPWTDLTNAALGSPSELMGGTKGSHIVLDHPELARACAGRELFFENDDGRIVLIYPLLDRVLIGTTDIEADPSEPSVCTDEEVDYFFGLVRFVFPDIHLDQSQITFRFAGIRPLPSHGSLRPGLVSRDYRIVPSALPGSPDVTVLSLVGGKWTTFRAVAEAVARRALELLGRPELVSTAGLPIGGGRGFPQTEDDWLGWISVHLPDIPLARAAELLGRYGTRAADVARSFHGEEVLLSSAPRYGRDEVRYLVAAEHVVHLEDLVLRRTSLAFAGNTGREVLNDLAAVVAVELGWNPATTELEIARTERVLALSSAAPPRPGRARRTAPPE